MTRYLFISGVGRSGTTALRNSIGTHPEVYYNGKENNIVQDLIAVSHQNITMESRRFALTVSPATYYGSFEDLILQIIWPEKKRRKARTLVAAVNLEPYLIETLRHVFQDCQVVCLVRNGIGVISSRMKYRSFQDGKFAEHCHVWLRSSRMAQWAKENPKLGRVVRQEWFSDEDRVAQEFSELFEWAEMTSSSLPAENILTRRYHPTDAEKHDSKESCEEYGRLDEGERKSFESNRLDRWKNWTRQQQDYFVETCGEAMKDLGYPIPWL